MFEYVIPAYQRPYAWTEEEVVILFDDLYRFYSEEDKTESYFLGTIVIVKEDNKPNSDVIDGQQRLTTLTILLAALASQVSGKMHDDFMKYLFQEGSLLSGIESMILPVMNGHRVKHVEVLQTPWDGYFQWHYGDGRDCKQRQYIRIQPDASFHGWRSSHRGRLRPSSCERNFLRRHYNSSCPCCSCYR